MTNVSLLLNIDNFTWYNRFENRQLKMAGHKLNDRFLGRWFCQRIPNCLQKHLFSIELKLFLFHTFFLILLLISAFFAARAYLGQRLKDFAWELCNLFYNFQHILIEICQMSLKLNKFSTIEIFDFFNFFNLKSVQNNIFLQN